MKKFLSLLATILLINTVSAQSIGKSEQEVRIAFQEFLDAFQALDQDKLLEHISKDERSTIVLGNTAYKGNDVREYFSNAIASTRSFDSLHVSGITVEPIDKKHMMLHCSFFEKYTFKGNAQSFSFDGAAMYIFRKEKAQWRILHAAGGGVFR